MLVLTSLNGATPRPPMQLPDVLPLQYQWRIPPMKANLRKSTGSATQTKLDAIPDSKE
jgi:hypothetical protein